MIVLKVNNRILLMASLLKDIKRKCKCFLDKKKMSERYNLDIVVGLYSQDFSTHMYTCPSVRL